MDLNYLFRCHQISLFREDSATSVEARVAHRKLTAMYADRIGVLQRSLGGTSTLAPTA